MPASHLTDEAQRCTFHGLFCFCTISAGVGSDFQCLSWRICSSLYFVSPAECGVFTIGNGRRHSSMICFWLCVVSVLVSLIFHCAQYFTFHNLGIVCWDLWHSPGMYCKIWEVKMCKNNMPKFSMLVFPQYSWWKKRLPQSVYKKRHFYQRCICSCCIMNNGMWNWPKRLWHWTIVHHGCFCCVISSLWFGGFCNQGVAEADPIPGGGVSWTTAFFQLRTPSHRQLN